MYSYLSITIRTVNQYLSSEKDISDLYFFKVDFTLDKPIPCSDVPFLLMS